MPPPLAIAQRVKLANYTSWQVGGEAEYFCLPKNLDEVIAAQKWATGQGMDIHVLGGGSNVLIADQGISGLTICLKSLVGLQISESEGIVHFEVMAGTSKSELLKNYLKLKLEPAFFLAGLPGDTGGGVVMNAGVSEAVKPREFTEITEWVDVLKPDGHVQRYNHGDLRWSYRHCEGWQPGIIVRVGLRWPNEPKTEILDQVREANKIRLHKQPLDLPSCGSVFVNPPGEKAAQLIESAGLKGFQIGQAQVSKKHANFIVNLGGAKADEIWRVIRHIQQSVKDKTGVRLRTEVILMGSWTDFEGREA